MLIAVFLGPGQDLRLHRATAGMGAYITVFIQAPRYQYDPRFLGPHPLGYAGQAFPLAQEGLARIAGPVLIYEATRPAQPTAGLTGVELMSPGIAGEPTFAAPGAAPT
jgi:hypothetical protein